MFRFLVRAPRALRTFSTSSNNNNNRGVLNVPNYPVDINPTPESGNDGVTPQEPEQLYTAGADYNNVGRVRCYNCGQVGHISYDCRIPQVRKACYQCGNPGHVSRDCPQKVRVVTCFRCKKLGHMAHECPDRPDSFE